MGDLFNEIDKYSTIYEFNFQFWPDQCAVYLRKDGIDLFDTGGNLEMEDVIKAALSYIYRVNNVKKSDRAF